MVDLVVLSLELDLVLENFSRSFCDSDFRMFLKFSTDILTLHLSPSISRTSHTLVIFVQCPNYQITKLVIFVQCPPSSSCMW